MAGYRGRLIFPMICELALIDTDGAEQAGRQDPVFRTLPASNATGVRRTGRYESPTTIRLHAQVEDISAQRQRQIAAGNAPESRLGLVFHFEELEELGLVDADGLAKVRVNDRLVAIYDADGDELQERFPGVPGGLYCVEVPPHSFGLSGGKRNLCPTFWNDRAQGKIG